jgi:hypothetical protein
LTTLRLAFEDENIESRLLWKPLHLQPLYEKFPYYGGSVAQNLFSIGLCLPSGSNLTAAERTRIKNVVQHTFKIKKAVPIEAVVPRKNRIVNYNLWAKFFFGNIFKTT